MRPIADPIHQAQSPVVERTLREVVLDQNEISADATCLEQDRQRIPRMVQDVNEHAAVKRPTRKWQMNAIEGDARDGALGARRVFRAGYGEPGNGLAHGFRYRAVSASYIQQCGCCGEHACQPLGEYGDPTLVNHPSMRMTNQLYARPVSHHSPYSDDCTECVFEIVGEVLHIRRDGVVGVAVVIEQRPSVPPVLCGIGGLF